MGSAPDPADPKTKDEDVTACVGGLIRVPLDNSKCEKKEKACKPKWLNDLPVSQQRLDKKLGMMKIQSLGPAGEDARLILGWASVETIPENAEVGISDEYYIAEIDEQGNRVSAAQSLPSGWGEDDMWASIPESGCVAWGFTWTKVGQSYGNSRHAGVGPGPNEDEFSNVLR